MSILIKIEPKAKNYVDRIAEIVGNVPTRNFSSDLDLVLTSIEVKKAIPDVNKNKQAFLITKEKVGLDKFMESSSQVTCEVWGAGVAVLSDGSVVKYNAKPKNNLFIRTIGV